jgi:DNA repair exonuclease SbcCD ATPase subunit
VAAERELAQAGQAVATATAEVADAKTNLEAVAAKRAAAADNLRANRAHLESLRTRAAVLQERHGADRTPRIAALDEAQKQATERLAGSRNHLAELNPEDLERNRDRLERTLELLASRKQDAETKRHLAKAKLDLQGTTDPREDMARATARRRLAAAEHARAVRDAEALKLLAGLFGEKKREVEEQFVAPLTSRIRGYLEQIFGKGTTVGVDYRDGTFSRLTLCRPRHEDTAFEFSQLSAGTKEQVAAAFRLAMAEVLSDDHDGCLPVVFDDAFVNADSHRHVRLQQLLDYAASRGLQVIVLACRPDMYLGLGAKMIELPGNPYAAANPADPR